MPVLGEVLNALPNTLKGDGSLCIVECNQLSAVLFICQQLDGKCLIFFRLRRAAPTRTFCYYTLAMCKAHDIRFVIVHINYINGLRLVPPLGNVVNVCI